MRNQNKKHNFVFFLWCLIICMSCNPNIVNQTVTASVRNSEIYEYRTGISGDEEGASIIVQAKHFEISEIVRNAETQWEAVYRYKSQSGYTGSDYVELELSTGSDGESPPTKIEIVRIEFMVGEPNSN